MDTTSLGFQKPKEEEYYDINIFNKNTQLANDLIEKNSSAIGQITNTRGYSNIPIISTDILLKNTNGWCRGINIPNAPIQNTWVFYRTVIMGDSFPWGYGFVRAYDYENKKEFVNFRSTLGWEGWREIPTVNNISNPPLNINVDFKVWQRGTSFVNAVNIYTADRWKADIAVGNITVTKTADGIKVVNNVEGYNGIAQVLESDKSLIGKTVTFSCLVKSNCNIYAIFRKISAGVGTTIASSSIQSASSEYKLLTVTTKLDNLLETDNLMVKIQFAAVTGEFEVKYAKLELGEIATPLSPRPYGEELALCQRYYYKDVIFSTISKSLNGCYVLIFLPVTMRSAPSCSFSYANLVNNISVGGYVKTADNVAWNFYNSQLGGNVRVSASPSFANSGDITYMEFVADAEIY